MLFLTPGKRIPFSLIDIHGRLGEQTPSSRAAPPGPRPVSIRPALNKHTG